MRITDIQMRGVGVHDDAAMSLPATGAVVVTGPNGAGKSSYVEAVALALWGESLRGVPLWREGQAGEVEVLVEVGGRKLHVARKRTKVGAKSLSFTVDDAPPVKYETPTKAQDALEALIGTFDSWRRTAVLSSADSAHFSLATDAERKRLLERLLGIDRLDQAAAAALADLRQTDARVRLAEQAVTSAEREADAAVTRVDEIRAAQAAAAPEPASPAPAVDHRLALRVAQDELADVQEQQRATAAVVANLRARANEAAARAARCAADACPTCEQAIPTALRDTLASEAATAKADAVKAASAADQQGASLAATARELSKEIEELRTAKAAADAAKAAAEKMAAVQAALGQQLERADAARIKADALWSESRAELSRLEGEHKIVKAVREVFGFRGVRAHLLDTALRRIETVANRHLGVLRAGMRVALLATTDKKTGGSSDAISLRVVVRAGAAARPYASLSGGERRRVDVAVLLALADVAGSVAGHEGTTLWLDEVFDALDGDGTSAVGQLVERLAATRTAVVITHAAGLVQELRAAKRIEMQAPTREG